MRRIASLLFVIAFACLPAAADDKPAGDAKPKLQPVDFRKLKELLPAQMVGLKRTKNDGQKLKAGDVTITSVEARYEKAKPEGQTDNADADKNADADPPSVDVSIMDYANTEAAGGFAAAWANNEIDQEGDNGYQKTVKVAGQPALESYDKQAKQGTLQVYAADRFIVSVTTHNLAPEKTQEIAKALQIDKLAAMK